MVIFIKRKGNQMRLTLTSGLGKLGGCVLRIVLIIMGFFSIFEFALLYIQCFPNYWMHINKINLGKK